MKKIILVLALCITALSLSGCVVAEMLSPEPTPTPTPTPPPPTIRGTLRYASAPIEGAEVTLTVYEDEACVELAKGTDLSESKKQQLDECSSEYATVTSSAEGAYEFPDVEPGWYKLKFQWIMAGPPESTSPFEIVNGFLMSYFVTESTPKRYMALAQKLDFIQFTGEEEVIVDF